MQIMPGQQDRAEHLVGAEEVVEVGAAVLGAGWAGARGVDGGFVFLVAGVADVQGAVAGEGLAGALGDGNLQGNIQGMTTGGGLDLFGLGASSISHLSGIGFLQNTHDIDDYVANLEDGVSPVRRGKRLTNDDAIRQALLSQLYCTGEIHPRSLKDELGIDFGEYFARELGIMRELREDGLVEVDDDNTVRATVPLGRVLIRNIAGVFDAYRSEEHTSELQSH